MSFYIRFRVVNPHSGVEWFDGQGNHPVDSKTLYGNRLHPLGTVEAVLAHHINVHMALQAAATAMYVRAASNLAAHRDTGNSKIMRTRGDKLDWFISLVDAGNGGQKKRKRSPKMSALSIEFGHLTKGGNRTGGLFVLTGAANAMAKNSGKKW